MPRTKDLDTVAPDDLVSASPRKPNKPKRSHPQGGKPKKQTSKSADQQYRQKVYKLIGHTKHPLSSFLARPKVFDFDDRDGEEEIILVLRRHWFTNLNWILVFVLMLIFPSFLDFVPLLESFPSRYNLLFVIFWYLISFAVAFEKFLSWYFNVFIVTEERVVDIDFNNLLNKEISDAKISMIQDVTYTVTGVSQTIFNYGDVFIQTAAEIPVIEISQIPNPNTVAKILQQMRLEEEQEALEGRIK
ncbi:hypothetical protein KKA02_03860 [Patescibacteria group bacterium]|nr:hypothetical protein [Patescibacteria group bacterium]